MRYEYDRLGWFEWMVILIVVFSVPILALQYTGTMGDFTLPF